MKTPVTIAHGDGIDLEITDATLFIPKRGRKIDTVEVGKAVERPGQGHCTSAP